MVTPFRAASTQVNGLFQQFRMREIVISTTHEGFQEWHNNQEQTGRIHGSQCIRRLLAPERGVYAASLSLFPQVSQNSDVVGSFTLKRPEGRAPTNRQLLDAPFHASMLLGRSAEVDLTFGGT